MIAQFETKLLTIEYCHGVITAGRLKWSMHSPRVVSMNNAQIISVKRGLIFRSNHDFLV
jgi:hypothetical protein